MRIKSLILALSLISFLHSAPTALDEFEETPQNQHSNSYILPLSYDDDAPILIVPVPEKFQLFYDGSSSPDILYLEFAPEEESEKWGFERITLCQSTETLDAHKFIKVFKGVMEEVQGLESFPNYTSYIRCTSERGIKVGYYVSEHPWINPHQTGIAAPRYVELLKIKTVQGEDRVWVIQYAVRYDPRSLSDEEHDEILEKMQVFFKSCRVSNNVTGSPI